MPELHGRDWRIEAGGRVFEGYDMRGAARWPRDGAGEVSLTVYHPPETLIAAVRDGERVSVLAGYAGNTGPVEIGGGVAIQSSIEFDRMSVDRPMTVQLRATTVAQRVILSGSWDSTTARQVLDFIAREAGLELDDQTAEDVEYPFGYYIGDSVQSAVAAIAEDMGARWSIENATLTLWPASVARRETAVLWSPSTGLMYATQTKGEIQVLAFMTPGLRKGHAARLLSTEYKGDVRAIEVVHEFDTQGDTWQTTAVVVPRG